MTDNEKLIKLMSNPKRYKNVIGYLSRYYDVDAVRDAVSDVMLTLLDGTLIYRYDAKVKPESFVIACARYRLVRPVKTVSLDAPIGDGNSVLADILPGRCDVDETMDRLDASFCVRKASQRIKKTSLGKRYQVLKLLKFGLSPREIVEFLNITMDDVMRHISDIRTQFKECLV